MSASISLPLWLALLAFLLAAVLVLDRMLLPSVRWFLRRRVNKVVGELNARLHLKIQPFKLTKRQVLIDRLIFDPEVLAAVERASGRKLDVRVGPCRPGDAPMLIADTRRIRKALKWRPRLDDLDAIVTSAQGWERRLVEAAARS